jgi:alpha-beta hydrolase superfamily lysophospholipase/translation elongation factor EF-1beta
MLSEWRPEGWEARSTNAAQDTAAAAAGREDPCPPPVLVYIHGNAGGRCDVLSNGLLEVCAARGWCLMALDCGGSGLSDGLHVTLGHFESGDLAIAVQHARGGPNTPASAAACRARDGGAAAETKIEVRMSGSGDGACRWPWRKVALYGFSMGGATTILYCQRSGSTHVAAVVVDSSFSSLRSLALTHPECRKVKGAKAALMLLFPYVRGSVWRRTGKGLDTHVHLNIAKAAKGVSLTLPAAFISAGGDPIVPSRHAEVLLSAWRGVPKQRWHLANRKHDHNTPRPRATLEEVADFLAPFLGSLPRATASAAREGGFYKHRCPESSRVGAEGEDASRATPFVQVNEEAGVLEGGVFDPEDGADPNAEEMGTALKEAASARLAAKEALQRSLCTMEIKPWEASQDLPALFAKIQATVMRQGLKWSEQCQLVEMGYGVRKIVCTAVIGQELSMDAIIEEMVEETFAGEIQSMEMTSMSLL